MKLELPEVISSFFLSFFFLFLFVCIIFCWFIVCFFFSLQFNRKTAIGWWTLRMLLMMKMRSSVESITVIISYFDVCTLKMTHSGPNGLYLFMNNTISFSLRSFVLCCIGNQSEFETSIKLEIKANTKTKKTKIDGHTFRYRYHFMNSWWFMVSDSNLIRSSFGNVHRLSRAVQW